MKKYKTAMIVLFVFMCVVAVLQSYRIVNDIYSIVWTLKYEIPIDTTLIYVFGLIMDSVIFGFSVFGIVVSAKIVNDKQLFNPSEPSADEQQSDKQ